MWFIENRLVFQPTVAVNGWADAPHRDIEDVYLTSPAGTAIHAWWLPAAASAPTMLFFSGNAGNLSGRGGTLIRARDQLGVSALIFDYPGYGKSRGRPTERGCYDAAEGAIRWLGEMKHIAPESVIFYGESLGGGVATELATRHSCRTLVLVKTFTSLPAVAKSHFPWLPAHWLMTNRFDSLAKIGRVRYPVFVAGATADSVVPYLQSEQLFAAANEPKQFFQAEATNHNDRLPDHFWLTLRTFLELA